MKYKSNIVIKIGSSKYTLGEKVLLDASNLKMGEFYIEHTEINPDRFELQVKDYDTENVENSWKILQSSH